MSNVQYNGNFRSPATWQGDFGGREHVMPIPARVNVSAFPANAGIKVVLSSGASADATTLAVTALAASGYVATTISGGVAIPAGTPLDFGGKKFARLTADANVGATSLTVAAIPTALSTGDTAYYSKVGRRFIPSGTYIGRTIAERDASTAFGPAATSDDERYLTYNDVEVTDGASEADVELYRHDSLVKENYLPDYTTLNTAANEVQAVTIGGTSTAGTLKIGLVNTSGALVWTDTIAWNATNGTIITNINTALDNLLGAGLVVAADNSGSAANPAFTLTFSGAGYTNLQQPPVAVDVSALTGATTVTVTQSTEGGKALLFKIREDYQCEVGKN